MVHGRCDVPKGKMRLRLWYVFLNVKRSALLVIVLGVAAAMGPVARAQEPQAVSAEDRKAAAKAFNDGEKAFAAGDFEHAGEAFDAAYKLAPHIDPLWNAAQAWHRAGEDAKAANRYAKYLRDAPPDAADRNNASLALQELGKRLGRVDLYAPNVKDTTIDGAPIDGPTVYTNPGTHVISGKSGDHDITRKITVDAGGVVSAELVDEPKP